LGAGEASFDEQAAFWLGACGDGCVVGVGDGLDDGQAQADPVVAAGAVCGEPLERLEELVYRSCRDGGPGVGHR
jgi:hypothetical protein